MMILKSFLTVNTLFLVCLLSTNVMGGNVRRRVLDGVPHRNLQVDSTNRKVPLTENAPHVNRAPRQLLNGEGAPEVESGFDLNSEPMPGDPMNTPPNPDEETPFGPGGGTPGEDLPEVESGFDFNSEPMPGAPPANPEEEIPFGLMDP